MRMKNLLLGITALLLAGAIAALWWFDSHFEEPDAQWVESVAGDVEARSVLAVFAHPDDEQLVTGLLIRARERDDAITRIVTFTRGEAGTPMPQISRPEDLGTIRHAELLKNGYALGVSEQGVLEYPDGGLVDADFEEYATVLSEYIVRWQPDLVVTFWPESGYTGHADHMMVGRVATEVVRRLQADDPETAPRAIAYVLAPRQMMSRFGGEVGARVAANQPEPTHAMPGEGWAKIRGWEIHASQADFVREVYGFPPWFLHRIHDKEHYRVEQF
ncbi:PIG-L family deacetylase [Parasphingopyxis sp. CP4]|uniref:PIG-L deacetylase family protein n=1 Tax=Parasphingopyxis sp. CP4 TaxID=2724527 RepID=UPI0015A21BF8|nr:PIG-L family deacetylase [Parasphingopyxis sp. CP4]QLC22067.1 PIG-L family deacetylase [Parasphingopyxis sp. CP4]